eukprot:15269472-Alexandrium_andersonii.AAC.1
MRYLERHWGHSLDHAVGAHLRFFRRVQSPALDSADAVWRLFEDSPTILRRTLLDSRETRRRV